MSDAGEKERNLHGIAACIAAALLFVTIYAGSYFALSEPTLAPRLSGSGSSPARLARIQTFRFGGGVAAILFWPLTQMDMLVRPGFWAADELN